MTPNEIHKAVEMYLFHFKLQPVSQQNAQVYWTWIAENWDSYHDTWPYTKK